MFTVNVRINKKKKGKGKLEKEKKSPSRDRTWVACVINQQDNDYTTPTADSVSEIKYQYMIRAYYGRLALSKVVIAFNDALQDTALKTPILISSRCRFGYFDRSTTYQIFQKRAPFHLIYKADYPDHTKFFI